MRMSTGRTAFHYRAAFSSLDALLFTPAKLKCCALASFTKSMPLWKYFGGAMN